MKIEEFLKKWPQFEYIQENTYIKYVADCNEVFMINSYHINSLFYKGIAYDYALIDSQIEEYFNNQNMLDFIATVDLFHDELYNLIK